MVHRTWPFVGREQLVGDLPARLDAGRHIILNGPAGLGKTRLAQHISDLYAARGLPVHRIVATPGSPLALAPFATLLGAEAAAPSGDAVVAVRRALGRARDALPGPLLVVDDLHLLDDASATVVHQLLAGGSVRLLATQRSGAHTPPAVDRLRQELGVEHVDLPPLGDDQIIAMVEAALKAPLAGHARQLVASSAAGNPMYARELVEGSLAAGALARHGGVFDFDARMVATALLEEVVLARLGDFQGAERTAIEVLALGGRLDAALLERIVGLSALETLERSDVVVATAWRPEPRWAEPRWAEPSGRHTAGGTRSARPEVLVDLAHPLYRELTRARLGNLARMRLYRTLADASVEQAAEADAAGASAQSPALTAAELQSITWQVRGGRSVAPEVLTAAAHRAISTGNSPLAAELALEAAQVSGTTEAALLASWCHSLNGDHATSIELLRAALPREADPWACAAIRLRIAEEHWWTGELAAGQAVLDEAAAEDGPGAALAAAQRSAHAVLAGFPGPAVALSAELIEHDHPWVRFVAVVGYSLGLIFGDDPARGLAVSRALTDSLSGADIPPIGDPAQHHAIQLFGLLQTGAVAQAREVADTAYRSTAASPSVQARAWAAMSLGHAAELAGDLAAAARVLAEADRLWAGVRVWGFAVWCGAALTRVQVMRGDVDEAATTLARTQGYPRPPQMLNGHLLDIAAAWVAHGQGDRAAAVAALRAALSQVQASGSVTNLAETWHEAARLDLLADLIDSTDSTDSTGTWARPVGPLAAARHTFVQARIRGTGDEIGFAATRFEEFGMSLYAAEAASSAATAYRRQGLAKEAAGWEGKAAALSAELGPVSLPLLGARSSSGVLTAREAQIARLAADGLSNRQIAARLVVSERTVENHLYRCFTKLSVTSRDQLAQALAGEPVSS